MPHHIRYKLNTGYKNKPLKNRKYKNTCHHAHNTLMADHKLYKIFFPRIKKKTTINVID